VKVRVKAIVKDLVGVMVILMAVGCCSASFSGVDFDKKIHSIKKKKGVKYHIDCL
jgi:hypothetical protein